MSNKNPKVKCVVHNQPVMTDCELKECFFHTSYPGIRNCMLVYAAKSENKIIPDEKENIQKPSALNTLDLSMLLGIPHKSVVEDIDFAINLMRQASVGVVGTSELEHTFSVLEDLSICYYCEKPLNEDYINIEGYKYCSNNCLSSKPINIIKLEKMCGTNIKNILEWAILKYSDFETLKSALALDRGIVKDLFQKYLNLDVEKYFTKNTETPNVSIVSKRTGRTPIWLTEFEEKIININKKAIKKFGPLMIDLAPLKVAVEASLK